MQSTFLLPHKYKIYGWIIFIPSLIIAFLTVLYEWNPDFFTVNTFVFAQDEIFGKKEYFSFSEVNIFCEIFGILAIIGGIMVAFSKTKLEDEFIQSLRLKSLVWATYLNYAVLILAIAFVYGIAFFWVLLFNIFTLLLFFIARFHYSLYSIKKQQHHEE